MLLLCFAASAFASVPLTGYTVIEYSDALCTDKRKTHAIYGAADEEIGKKLNNDGVCDEEDKMGYKCMASNIIAIHSGGESCSEGGDTNYLLVNQCNTVYDKKTKSVMSYKLTDLSGCLDKGGTKYYAQMGFYGAHGCADSDLGQTQSIGTSDPTDGANVKGVGVNYDGNWCAKCSGAGLAFTEYADEGCTGAADFTTGELNVAAECLDFDGDDYSDGKPYSLKLLAAFGGCPGNEKKFGDDGTGTKAAFAATISPSPPSLPPPPEDKEKKEDTPCFGRDTYAISVNGKPVAMASLRSGDYVMDGPDSFTRVIVNQHAAVSFKSSLLLIGTKAATPLSITPDHVLSVDGKFVPAQRVIVGSKLSEHEVVSVTLTTGAVINPLTASGKILTQGGILSSTYPEWIADYMLSSALFPLPFSLSNMLSYLFPEATQNYYDAVLEDFVTRHHPATLPKATMPVAFILGDLAVSAGFVLFNLASAKVLGALAAIACTAAAAKKK